jgi:hypothetical protein
MDDNPKSVSIPVPDLETRMLAPLRSPWIIPRE